MDKKKIEELNKIINESKYIVFFGGAGVSTESGIPDFRSKDGLYNEKYDFPPEFMLSHDCFIDYPEEFYKFYFDKMIYKDALPNDCHKKLKELEDKGSLKCIITQNIDGLHSKAGSKNVIELHGNVNRLYCTMCDKLYALSDLKNKEVPYCNCGGILKPDVVLYGEALNAKSLRDAMYQISKADTLIVGGTSLVVHPACDLVNLFNGDNLIIINKEKTPFDDYASLVMHDSIGKVFKKVKI